MSPAGDSEAPHVLRDDCNQTSVYHVPTSPQEPRGPDELQQRHQHGRPEHLRGRRLGRESKLMESRHPVTLGWRPRPSACRRLWSGPPVLLSLLPSDNLDEYLKIREFQGEKRCPGFTRIKQSRLLLYFLETRRMNGPHGVSAWHLWLHLVAQKAWSPTQARADHALATGTPGAPPARVAGAWQPPATSDTS